jgi:hypothetical protein
MLLASLRWVTKECDVPFKTIGAIAFVAMTGLPLAHGVQTRPVPPDSVVLADFNARIKTYVALRSKADDGAPPLTPTRDAAKIKAAQDALAIRIRAARVGAKRGDIFTPDIQRLFVALLRPPLQGAKTREIIEHDNPGKLALIINGKYPDEAPLSTVPPNVLASLPLLPKDVDLDYRFVDKHLILRDGKANLIVDFIANAIR